VSFSENAANNGKIVIISALDGTFQRKNFGSILDLIPLAEKVKKLAAICKICGFNASFTFRTVLNDQIELIGGDSMYIPLCRECFNREQALQVEEGNNAQTSRT
jgi:thymidine kinase